MFLITASAHGYRAGSANSGRMGAKGNSETPSELPREPEPS
jgi:hypothetical protein